MVIQGSQAVRAIPGVRNFGSHIGQALLGEEIAGVDFGENWISVDPNVDYDETRAQIEETVSGFPGMFTNVETYLAGADQRGDHRRERADRGAHRRAGPRRAPGEGRRGEGGDGAGQGHRRRARRAAAARAADRGRRRPGQGPGVRHQAGRRPTRAAATLMAGEEVGDIFRDGQDLRRPGLERAGVDARASATSATSSSTRRERQPGAPRRRCHRHAAADTEQHPARRHVAPHRHRRRRAWPRPRLGGSGPAGAPRPDRLPARAPRRADRRVPGAPERPEPPPLVRRASRWSASCCSATRCSGTGGTSGCTCSRCRSRSWAD